MMYILDAKKQQENDDEIVCISFSSTNRSKPPQEPKLHAAQHNGKTGLRKIICLRADYGWYLLKISGNNFVTSGASIT